MESSALALPTAADEEPPLALDAESARAALDALEAEIQAKINRREAQPDPNKPQRLTPQLIAERCLDKAEASVLSAEDVAERLMGLRRLRLDRLRLNSMDGLELVGTGATHILLQHNLLTHIDGLEFFSKLQYLVLSHNQISRIAGVSHLSSLQYLDLAHNLVASADTDALPKGLMALELVGNPCAAEEGYRAKVVAALPRLVYLDEVRVGEEEEEEGEEEEGEEEEEEDDDEEDGEAAEERGMATTGGAAAGRPPPTEAAASSGGVSARGVGGYLSGAKAQVDAQLAAVDALLVQSGYDAAAAASTPSAARDGADGADEGGADPRDAGALYSRALEMYGVNADADATKEKIRAVKARAEARRKEFMELQEGVASAYRAGSGGATGRGGGGGAVAGEQGAER